MRQHLQFPDGAIPIKTVNGIGPDESGNVTIETGGAVDESACFGDVGGGG